MAGFVQTRNSLQCRSHHQKLEEKYHFPNKIISNYKKNFWIPALKSKVGFIENNMADETRAEEVNNDHQLLINEIGWELERVAIEFEGYEALKSGPITKEILASTSDFLKRLNRLYINIYKEESNNRDNIIRDLHAADSDEAKKAAKAEQE